MPIEKKNLENFLSVHAGTHFAEGVCLIFDKKGQTEVPNE